MKVIALLTTLFLPGAFVGVGICAALYAQQRVHVNTFH
jgi:uncharacterized membrane protein YciS (DUF1049 family)